MKRMFINDWILGGMGVLAVTTAFGLGTELLAHQTQMYIFSGLTALYIVKRMAMIGTFGRGRKNSPLMKLLQK